MHQITLTLRKAYANDFKTISGVKQIGTMYFEMSATGTMQLQPKYLNDETNIATFKALFDCGQIYVPIKNEE